MEKIIYKLPDLPYGYKDLSPYISEEQLMVHHQKHHQAYVNNVNAVFDMDMKAILKDFSFNVGGNILHTIFWENMIPTSKTKELSGGRLFDEIISEFGSIERFKKEFSQAALSVEGSGWSSLVYSGELKKLMIMQIEKHNTNLYPNSNILMVLDMFEHAYYIDYKNDKAKFIDSFWHVVNWEYIEKRFSNLLNKNI
jgi:Fe-Mn family superoxide dismutase